MNHDVRRDFDWQLGFLPSIRRVVGPHLLVPASPRVDMREATDMVILDVRGMQIGCRVRRAQFEKQYPYEFTIRYSRPSGVETEWHKLTHQSWLNWIFYGFAAGANGPDLSRWAIIDVGIFRGLLINRPGEISLRPVPNPDGTSFLPIDIRQLRALNPKAIIDTSHPLPDWHQNPTLPLGPPPPPITPRAPQAPILRPDFSTKPRLSVDEIFALVRARRGER